MAEKKSKSRISPIFRRALSHLFTKPATSKYPFVKPKLPPDSRGKLVYEIKACNEIDFDCGEDFRFDIKSMRGSNCRVCERDCPTGAITIVEVEGKKRPQIDLNRCIFCSQCVDSCPRGAITMTNFFELATTDKNSLVMKPEYKDKSGA